MVLESLYYSIVTT